MNEEFNAGKVKDELVLAFNSLSKGKDFNYAGYDISETSLRAVIPEVKDRLTLDYLEYRKERQDESFLEIFITCCLNLGYDAGFKDGREKQKMLHETGLDKLSMFM